MAESTISEMTPGTTFTAMHIDREECGGVPHRWFVYWSEGNHLVNDNGQRWGVGSVDQASVRDVVDPPWVEAR